MNIFEKIISFFSLLFRHSFERPEEQITKAKPKEPVRFSSIIFVEKPPKNNQINSDGLYCVLSGNKPKWALFQCPCGCSSVITLSLQSIHCPHWRLSKSNPGRPTLHPSVWRDEDCFSHFWLNDGRILWCFDTGTHPDLRKSY